MEKRVDFNLGNETNTYGRAFLEFNWLIGSSSQGNAKNFTRIFTWIKFFNCISKITAFDFDLAK